MSNCVKNTHVSKNIDQIVEHCDYILTPTAHTMDVIKRIILKNNQIKGKAQSLPAMHTPRSWLTHLFEVQTLLEARILSHTESLFVWQQMKIKNININMINKSVNLIYQQKNPTFTPESFSPKQSFLKECMQHHQQILTTHHAWTLFEGYHHINQRLQNDPLFAKAQRIACIGFTDIPPVLITHLQQLAKHHSIHCHTPIQPPAHIQMHTFQTPEQEYQAVLDWALQQNTNSIALAMGPIDQASIESLYHLPQYQDDCLIDRVHITRFQSLDQYPMIACALNLLKTLTAPAPYRTENWCHLLKNPFLGENHTMQMTLHQWAHALSATGTAFYPTLDALAKKSPQHLWQALTEWQQTVPEYQSLQGWQQSFQALLALWHWPGPHAHTSHHLQTRQAWDKACLQWQQLAPFTNSMLSAHDALEHLIFCCKQQAFQPKRSTNALLHIMPYDNFLGLSAPSLWVMQSLAEYFPPTQPKNDYLPTSLQNTTDPLPILKQSATNLTFSASLQKDGIEQTPSKALLMHQSNCPSPSTTNEDNVAKIAIKECNLDTHITPSTQQLQHYHSCPFRGFFEYTVDKHAIPPLTVGLDSAERGTLIHLILHRFWQQVGSQQALIQMGKSGQKAILTPIIEQALKIHHQQKPSILPKSFWHSEAKRLHHLMMCWLALELERPPFQVIATELPIEYTLNNHTFKLRLDRLDQDGAGQYWIIDYKTGLAHPSDWFGPRPEQPQMPLYALALNKPISGLVYGIIRADGVHFKGLANNSSLKGIDTPTANWSTLLDNWHATLTEQLEHMEQGHSTIDPKTPQSCQYCHLHSVCRYHLTG